MNLDGSPHNSLKGVIYILIVALGFVIGITTGLLYHNEIYGLMNKNINDESNIYAGQVLDKNRFEINGFVAYNDSSSSYIGVKVASSSSSIRATLGNVASISIASGASIVYQNKTAPTLADIPIGAQVQVSGQVKNNTLVANKIEVQKETISTSTGQTKFELNGTVVDVGDGLIHVDVKSANKLIAGMRGKKVEIKIAANTVINKGGSQVALAGLKAGDTLNITGIYQGNVLTAANISAYKIGDKATFQNIDWLPQAE